MDTSHTDEAAAYFRIASIWFERKRDVESAAYMRVLLAPTWEAHADAAPSALVRHHFYRDAIRS